MNNGFGFDSYHTEKSRFASLKYGIYIYEKLEKLNDAWNFCQFFELHGEHWKLNHIHN